ncbi:MAG: LysR substrate-binding domain-containing protein, partial [Alphaproteobacteria bacterium]
MRISHLNALRALEATLRTGNFRSASNELGVTPAAVGQQIRGLEEFVGYQLFVRKPSGVVPTEGAGRVAASLTASFTSISDVLMDLKQPRPGNRLAISMTQAFGEYWLTPRLADFYALGDQVDLRIDTTHRLVDLLLDEFDFAVRFGPLPDKSLDYTTLFGGCVVPICTPDFAARYGLLTDTKSLDGVPVIHVKDETTDPGWLNWQSWSDRFGIAYRGASTVPEFSRLSSGHRVAKAGLGLVLCGMLESHPSLTDGSIIMPFGASSITWTDYAYRLVWARGRVHSAMQNNFKSWIADQAKDYMEAIELL